MGRVRVFIACSLDGFIAGEGGDLSWLTGPDAVAGGEPESGDGSGAVTFDAFCADVGAMVMGRTTFDTVAGFDGPWAYPFPVFVATHREVTAKDGVDVRGMSGEIGELLDAALVAAGGKDVYVDGGDVIRQALDAGRIDEVIVTMVPVVLGRGHALFAGTAERHAFDTVAIGAYGTGGMVQWRLAARVPET